MDMELVSLGTACKYYGYVELLCHPHKLQRYARASLGNLRPGILMQFMAVDMKMQKKKTHRQFTLHGSPTHLLVL